MNPASMVLVVRCLVVVVCLASCSDRANDNAEARLAALASDVDQFDVELQDTEARVRSLSSDLDELAAAYDNVRERYRAARTSYEAAKVSSNASSQLLAEAGTNWERAAASWRFFRQVIRIAIQIDRARAATRGTDSFSCETVSTASFRRTLIARGLDLAGKDIDHIVPRALGGADHPSNYQVLVSQPESGKDVELRKVRVGR